MFGALVRRNFDLESLRYDIFRTSLIMCVLWGGVSISSTVQAQITELDVYNAPDDHELNLAYAKQQIIKGEMLDAGSALERMLFANPNWHSARLLYAAVLYRLDDQKAALRELSLLEGKDLNDEQSEKLESYKTAFQIPPEPVQAAISSEVNGNFDNSAPLTSGDYIQAHVSLQGRADSNAGNALTDANFGFDDEGDVSIVLAGKLRGFAPVTDKINFRGEIGGLGRLISTAKLISSR